MAKDDEMSKFAETLDIIYPQDKNNELEELCLFYKIMDHSNLCTSGGAISMSFELLYQIYGKGLKTMFFRFAFVSLCCMQGTRL